VDGGQAQLRESVVAFLERVKASGAESARQVERFQQRLPGSAEQGQGIVSGDELTFTAPDEIAAFGQNEPLEVLDGRSLEGRGCPPGGRASELSGTLAPSEACWA